MSLLFIAGASAQWSRVPIATATELSQGYMGGEGGQVVRDVRISLADPDFMPLMLAACIAV